MQVAAHVLVRAEREVEPVARGGERGGLRVEHLAPCRVGGFQLGARTRHRLADDRALRAVDALDRLADLVERGRLAEVAAFGVGKVVERSRCRERRRRPRARRLRRARRDRSPRSPRPGPSLPRRLEEQCGARHRDVERLAGLHRHRHRGVERQGRIEPGRLVAEHERGRRRGGRSARARRRPSRPRRGGSRPGHRALRGSPLPPCPPRCEPRNTRRPRRGRPWDCRHRPIPARGRLPARPAAAALRISVPALPGSPSWVATSARSAPSSASIPARCMAASAKTGCGFTVSPTRPRRTCRGRAAARRSPATRAATSRMSAVASTPT